MKLYKDCNVEVIKEGLRLIRKNYAGIKGVKIVSVDKELKRKLGMYNCETRTITIYRHKSKFEYINTLLHELAHHFQCYLYSEVWEGTHKQSAHDNTFRQCAKYLGCAPRAAAARSDIKLNKRWEYYVNK